MALVVGANIAVANHTTPNGFEKASDGKQVVGCFVSLSFTGTYATGTGFSAAVKAAIEGSRRDGRPVTILQACLAAPGKEAGLTVGAKTVATDGTNVTGLLTTDDFATERAATAMNLYDELLCLFVLYKH